MVVSSTEMTNVSTSSNTQNDVTGASRDQDGSGPMTPTCSTPVSSMTSLNGPNTEITSLTGSDMTSTPSSICGNTPDMFCPPNVTLHQNGGPNNNGPMGPGMLESPHMMGHIHPHAGHHHQHNHPPAHNVTQFQDVMPPPTDLLSCTGGHHHSSKSDSSFHPSCAVPRRDVQAGKEFCSGCERPIEDRFLLRVMDNSWHEGCLQCSVCRQTLMNSCFVKDRKLFCKYDYDNYFGTKCSGCQLPVPANELVMRALGSVYHLRCFLCVVCGHQLQKGDQFVVKDGLLFCRLDFEKEYAMMAQLSPKHDWGCHDYPKSDDDSSLDDVDMLGNSKAPKRPRTILNTAQRRKFKASFEVNPKPCRKVREALASETGLTVRVVQVWFQNQRAKMKKIQRRQNQDGDSKNRGGSGSSSPKGDQKHKRDDDDSDSSTQNEPNNNSMPGLPGGLTESQYSNQLRQYDVPDAHGNMFTGDTGYEGSVGMDNSLDSIDNMLLPGGGGPGSIPTHHPPTNTPIGLTTAGTIVNPIDKLYSMQSSYFNAE